MLLIFNAEDFLTAGTSISYSSWVKCPLKQTARAIRRPCLCAALIETLQSRPLLPWPSGSLPQIDLSCTAKGMRVIHWSGHYCHYFSLMKPKLVIWRVKLCGDLRACYCQSCQRDKRITGKISSMRVSEGRVKTFSGHKNEAGYTIKQRRWTFSVFQRQGASKGWVFYLFLFGSGHSLSCMS